VHHLANCCSIFNISGKGELLALRDENIGTLLSVLFPFYLLLLTCFIHFQHTDCCFIVLRGKISLCKRRRLDIGDPLDYRESMTEDDNVAEACVTRKSSSKKKTNPYKVVQEIRSGAFVGKEYWRGRLKWKYGN
jgi:hypothetical protein